MGTESVHSVDGFVEEKGKYADGSGVGVGLRRGPGGMKYIGSGYRGVIRSGRGANLGVVCWDLGGG
jgi:hypothetical protein